MADVSIALVRRGLEAALLPHVDPGAKIPAALEALGPIAERDVVVLEAGHGFRLRQLASLAATVTALRWPASAEPAAEALPGAPTPGAGGDSPDDWPESAASPGGPVRIVAGTPEASTLPDACADAVVSFWSAFLGPDRAQLAEADRLLRPGGRLLVVHDYGRDDVCDLWRDDFERQVEWSRRDGPFLRGGFRIRVVHSSWTFDSLEQAAELLSAFGEPGDGLARRLKRPRLEYNVAVYHRTRRGPNGEPEPPAAATL